LTCEHCQPLNTWSMRLCAREPASGRRWTFQSKLVIHHLVQYAAFTVFTHRRHHCRQARPQEPMAASTLRLSVVSAAEPLYIQSYCPRQSPSLQLYIIDIIVCVRSSLFHGSNCMVKTSARQNGAAPTVGRALRECQEDRLSLKRRGPTLSVGQDKRARPHQTFGSKVTPP
jgi:hypothetical protein